MCYLSKYILFGIVFFGVGLFNGWAEDDLYNEPSCGPKLIIRHEMRKKGLLGTSCEDPISQVKIDDKDAFQGVHSELFFGQKLKYGAIKCGESYAIKITPGTHRIKVFVENRYNHDYEVTVPENNDYEWTMFNNSIGGLAKTQIITKNTDKCDYCCERTNVNMSKGPKVSLDEDEDLKITNMRIDSIFSGDTIKITGDLVSNIPIKAGQLTVGVRIFDMEDTKLFDRQNTLRKNLEPKTTTSFEKNLKLFNTAKLKGRYKAKIIFKINKKTVFESEPVQFIIKSIR